MVKETISARLTQPLGPEVCLNVTPNAQAEVIGPTIFLGGIYNATVKIKGEAANSHTSRS